MEDQDDKEDIPKEESLKQAVGALDKVLAQIEILEKKKVELNIYNLAQQQNENLDYIIEQAKI